MRHSLWQRVVIVLFLFSFFQWFPVYGALAQTSQPLADHCLTTGWPQDASDLKPDPSLVFGRLANGLRYVVKANAKPKQRVAMYLNVQTGSLHETEDQRGVAHFLEHMLFNGTTHYPPGTLVKFFQSLGMGFGGDTNAHTGFDETVYNLLLPANNNKVIAEGFRVLADYARGALLLETEVDRERGVILAEKRSRDSAATRVSKKQMQFDFSETLVAKREPIGTEAVIKAADSHLLRRYYDRWYRPENMIVVVVGDIQPQAVESLLAKAFAPLQGVGSVGQCQDYGQLPEKGTEVLVYPEEELGYTNLALTTVFNHRPQPDTLAWETDQIQRYLAILLLSNRLKYLEEQPGIPLAQPAVQGGLFMGRYGFATLTGRVVAGRWQEGIQLLQATLAQALHDGFSAEELARGKREIHALLKKAVQTSTTRDSREVAEDIIRKLNDQEVVLSPEQEMKLYGPVLEKITLADINQAMHGLWGHPRRLLEVVGVLPLELKGQQGEAKVKEAFSQAEQAPLVPWVGEQRVSFPYLQPPAKAGTVASMHQYSDIGISTYQLAGGVQLNIKQTDFQANQVLLSVHFGQGKQAEPEKGLALLAQAVVSESGIGRLSNEQLGAALAGSNAELAFKIGPESFSFVGGSLTNEFELLLQLLYHHLHDPAFREDAFNRSRDSLQRMYRQSDNSVEGVQQIQGERFLAGSCPEYGMASWDEVAKVKLAQIRSWLIPAFTKAPLEINVVGDIDPQVALQLVNRYLGHENRRAGVTVPEATPIFPGGQVQQLKVASAINKTMLTVAWKTSDFWDIDRTRRLNLLAAILDDRLRVKIREELSATYSPQVISQPSRGHAGFGLMQSSLIVAPEQAESLAQVIKDVAASLGEKGVGEDELHRALEPILTSIKDIKRNNRYWMESVLNLCSRHPQQLDWPHSIMEGFAAIKAKELTALARQYLKPEQATTVIISPANNEKTQVGEAAR
ncbi:MAG: insulinase family protein [Desulfobulbus sp.]|nr:insulinase family protein [Desulfobulbus sp.]